MIDRKEKINIPCLTGRVNALSAQLEDSDDESGYEEPLIRYPQDLELGVRDRSTGSSEESGRTWSKLSPEELESEQQSSVSVMNSQFQKPKQQDKDTPNGCFHLLFKGECTRKEKCTYSLDPSVMAATHAHYENSCIIPSINLGDRMLKRVPMEV